MVTEQHPQYHRAAEHQNAIFQFLGFLIIVIIFTLALLLADPFPSLSLRAGGHAPGSR